MSNGNSNSSTFQRNAAASKTFPGDTLVMHYLTNQYRRFGGEKKEKEKSVLSSFQPKKKKRDFEWSGDSLCRAETRHLPDGERWWVLIIQRCTMVLTGEQ